MFWVYMLRCADGSYYSGHTEELARRIAEHQAGVCDGYTSRLLPVVVVWSEQFTTREEALVAERQIKGWSRKKKEALIRGDWAAVSRAAKKDFSSIRRTRQGISRKHPADFE
ncbi:MAG: GIY-YIG nuclease family protein [Gammaproteobacteria bacterium]|nr:GIY-YIG nuclease family protein [Gammaproteobacteria bacterium]